MPFKRELVTWASGHDTARKAALHKASTLFIERAGLNDPEFSNLLNLLTELMHASFAYGAITADLAAGRFR